MDRNRMQTTIKNLLEEARVKFKDVKVVEFCALTSGGIIRTDLRLYFLEGIVQVEYQHNPSYDFLQYPEAYQEVCLKHEVCEVIVNGCHWDTIETYLKIEDYFALAFIEFLVHKEFQSRYKEYIHTYRKKWNWEMMKNLNTLNIKYIESDIYKAAYSFMASLIFIPETLKQKFQEAGYPDLYSRMQKILESLERSYEENKEKPYVEKLRQLESLR